MTAYFKTTAKLLAAEWKRVLLPVVLIALLSILAGLFGNVALSKNAVLEPIHIALVNQDSSSEARLVLNTLTSQRSAMLRIAITDADNAKEMLQRGEVTAVFTIPAGFMQSVMSGRNLPLYADYNAANPLRSTLVAAFADSLTEMLKTAQAGVYASLDLAVPYGQAATSAVLQRINLRFLSLVMNRKTLFVEETVYSTGQLAPFNHYFVSVWVFLVALLAMMLRHIAARCLSHENIMMLKISRRGTLGPLCGLIAAYWLCHCAVNATVLAAYLFMQGIPLSSDLLLPCLAAILAVSFLQGAFAAFCGCAFSGRLPGSIFIGMFAALSLLLSGGLLPVSFLHVRLAQIGALLPAAHMRQLLGLALEMKLPLPSLLWVVGFGGLFSLAALLFVHLSGKAVRQL